MKVCISSAGRFHTFDLAREVARRGHLARLYTAYPRWKVEGIDTDRVSTFPWLMTPAMLANRLGLTAIRDSLNYPTMISFDRWTAAHLEPCEVFHCLSGFGVQSHRVARERFGAFTICDRGSSHILFQETILREEFERCGLKWPGIDPRVIDRELAEYEYCDQIWVPSRFSLNSFVQQGVPRSKLILNPYGVDLSMFRPMPKHDDVFRVLFVGSISVRKGVHYLLEACAEAGVPGQDVWLIGACEPDANTLLERYEGGFRLMGPFPRAELFNYFSQASVMVLPAIEEGLALVQAQALACGIPVIATFNSGAEDLFSDGVEGFIVPTRNPHAIAERIFQLREDSHLREQMSRAALERVRALGGWNAYGERAEQIYSRALEARRAA
jgi:alpha-maltose-1-phosphate synthase